MTSKLGPPLDLLLEPHLPPEQIGPAADRFREIYPDHAVVPTPAFPGVAEALAAVRRHDGRIVLVTGKHTPNAQLHVDHLGLDVDVVEGRVWGIGKGEVLRRHGAERLRRRPRPRRRGRPRGGDHLASRCSPAAAPARSWRQAGTDVVLADLSEFPGWLDGPPARDAAGRARGPASGARAADGRVQRRSRQRLPARGGGARARAGERRRRHGVLRLAPGLRARPRRSSSRGRSASRCSPRRPPRWSARATAPTTATGARSARPSCSTCSARWPGSTGTTPSRPAPTPTTPAPGSARASRRPPSAAP